MFGTIILKTIFGLFASIVSLVSLPPTSNLPSPSPTAPIVDPQQAALNQLHNLESQLATSRVEAQFGRILKRGLQGDDVKQLQQELHKSVPSFSADYVTGRFGPITEKTMQKFQTENHLSATGIFDLETRHLFAKSLSSGSFEKLASSEFSDLEDFLSNSENVASASVDTATPSLNPDSTPRPTPSNLTLLKDLPETCTNLGYIKADNCPVTECPITACPVIDCPSVPTAFPVSTVTPAPTINPSKTPTPSASPTKTPTPSPTPTPTPTKTPTPAPTPTKTPTPTASH